MELADPIVGAARTAEVVSFRCLEPLSPFGLGRDRFEFCALPRPRFLTTGGLSLASIAWARVTRLVSSLMGMIEWNPGPSFVMRSA